MKEISRRTMLKTTATSLASVSAFSVNGLYHGEGVALGQENPARKPIKKSDANSSHYADAKLIDGAPLLPKKNHFTIAVLPDTQKYCQENPAGFHAQTEWIVENKQDRNIACVLHLGDITNRNSPEQWKVAQAAMQRLDGEVPYFIVPGNHDYSKGGRIVDRTTRLNDYFPIKNYESLPTFGGAYDKEPDRMENTFHLFSAGGRDFLVLGLEFGPRNDVVRWANEVAEKHHQREMILITHAYMYFDDTRYDWKTRGKKQSWNPHFYEGITEQGAQDGEELWNNLVKKHNFLMTLNGHVLQDGLGRLVSKNHEGHDVLQMLVNFQMKPAGGDGWLRLIELSDNSQMVDVIDYSPTRNQCNASSQNKFSHQLS